MFSDPAHLLTEAEFGRCENTPWQVVQIILWNGPWTQVSSFPGRWTRKEQCFHSVVLRVTADGTAPFTGTPEREDIIPVSEELSLWKKYQKCRLPRTQLQLPFTSNSICSVLVTWVMHLRLFLSNHFRFLVPMKTLMTVLPWTSVPVWVAGLEGCPARPRLLAAPPFSVAHSACDDYFGMGG